MSGQILTISADEYHADNLCNVPTLSSSLVKMLLNKSPRHAYLAHPKLGAIVREIFEVDEVKRKLMDRGTVAHAILLEGRSDVMVVVNPEDHRSKPNKSNPDGAIPKGWTNNAIKEYRDEIRESNRIPMLPPDANNVMRMVAEAKRFMHEDCEEPAIRRIFDEGLSEQTILWGESGVMCRARLDRVSLDWRHALDYKTTFNAEPNTFSRQIASMDYYIQAEFHSRGVEAVKGRRPNWFFLAQECAAPFGCSMHGLGNAYMEIASSLVDEALTIWKSCMDSGKWPMYSGKTHYAEPPGYLLHKHMERTQDNEIESGSWQNAED